MNPSTLQAIFYLLFTIIVTGCSSVSEDKVRVKNQREDTSKMLDRLVANAKPIKPEAIISPSKIVILPTGETFELIYRFCKMPKDDFVSLPKIRGRYKTFSGAQKKQMKNDAIRFDKVVKNYLNEDDILASVTNYVVNVPLIPSESPKYNFSLHEEDEYDPRIFYTLDDHETGFYQNGVFNDISSLQVPLQFVTGSQSKLILSLYFKPSEYGGISYSLYRCSDPNESPEIRIGQSTNFPYKDDYEKLQELQLFFKVAGK